MPRPRRLRISFETRLTLLLLALGAPALGFGLLGARAVVADATARDTLEMALVALWLWAALGARERVVRPLQTLSNMLAAMREGDTSIRARGADTDSALGLALWELNALTETVRRRRFDALEAVALLRRVMGSIAGAVFAFDTERRLRLVNPGGGRLLAAPPARAPGRAAASPGRARSVAA